MKFRLLCVLSLAAGCATPSTNLELRSAEALNAPAHRSAYRPMSRPVDRPDEPRGSALQPVATEDLRLVWEGGKGPSIVDLVEEYARVTGLLVMYTDESRTQMQKHRINKAGGGDTLVVAAEEVVPVVETILVINQFVLVPMRDTEPRISLLISLETQERNQVKRSATYVPFAELEAYRRRPATLVTTAIRLPNTDVRTLSNSMRTMLTDANTQQIVPVGNSSALILTGFGPDVCDLAQVLLKIDAEEPPPLPVEQPETNR